MKCLALGAAAGMCKAMLDYVRNQGVEEAVDYIRRFHDQMRKIAVMIDASSIEEVAGRPLVFSPEILSWQKQRGLLENERTDK